MTSPFQILPAIDLKGGRCVRLQQGLADQETVYGEDPVWMAKKWQSEGASYLHVVDLDGAFEGRPMHTAVIGQIVSALDIPVEVGGGLRTREDIEALLNVGADRVILGTRACHEPDALDLLIQRYGRHLAVGIDARDGKVQVKGWTETSDLAAADLARTLDRKGIQTIIYTDTSRDGMLKGVNTDALSEVCHAVACDVIASGGVSATSDIQALLDLTCGNLTGAIVGKALYDERVSLCALLAVAGAGGVQKEKGA